MAKIVEHGKYWREDIQRADPGVLIKCPECGNQFTVSYYDCIGNKMEAWCECGCKFIPESIDVIEVWYD